MLRRRFVTGDVLLRRRFVTRRRFVEETFCYVDVLLRRRFVRRRFVEETFCKETFCMCVGFRVYQSDLHTMPFVPEPFLPDLNPARLTGLVCVNPHHDLVCITMPFVF